MRGLLGRHFSVRTKLTVWYGLMCGLTLAAAGFTMYLYVSHRLSNQIDSNLISTGNQLSRELRKPLLLPSYRVPAVPACTNADTAVIRNYCKRIQHLLNQQAVALASPGQFEQVTLDITARGSTATITPFNHPAVEPANATPLLFSYAAAGLIHYTTFTYQGHVLREHFVPLQLSPALTRVGYRGVIQVLQNESTYLDIEQIVLLTLLLGIPIGLLIAVGAGWWIARAALRPVNRIARTVRAIGESRDLSRRVNFRGPHDELGRLADTFDDMMDRLERVFETQKRFIADASHELRTPLTSIRGNADLMRIAPPEDQEICLSSIRREAERMSRLVSDLLVLAEADVADQQIQRGRVDLDDLFLDVYRNAVLIAGDKVTVVLEETDPVCVDGDADRLKQLLLNLIDNAVKFTPPGGTVSMGLWHERHTARMVISDSGVGIAPEEQAAIFERFYRVEEARSRRGSGLGLAISSWIVNAHGGSMSVSSAPGKGSAFTVVIPEAQPLPPRHPSGKAPTRAHTG